jgi:hypothetical protein
MLASSCCNYRCVQLHNVNVLHEGGDCSGIGQSALHDAYNVSCPFVEINERDLFHISQSIGTGTANSRIIKPLLR